MFFLFNTPDTIKMQMGKRLSAARESAGYNRAEAAQKFEWNYETVRSHEAGRRGFDRHDANKYARAYNADPYHLLLIDTDALRVKADQDKDYYPLREVENFYKTSSKKKREVSFRAADPMKTITGASTEITSPNIPVYGVAAGGLWLEGDVNPFEDDDSVIPAGVGYSPAVQYARLVRGNSVSNQIQDGTYAIFVRLEFYSGLRRGKLVDVERIRGGLREHTVKVFEGDRLLTDSAELDVQEAIPLDPGDADYEIRIVGVAIGSYRPL